MKFKNKKTVRKVLLSFKFYEKALDTYKIISVRPGFHNRTNPHGSSVPILNFGQISKKKNFVNYIKCITFRLICFLK